MIQIIGNDTPDVVVNSGSGFYPMNLCDFSGSYLIDPQPQEQNQNNITSIGEPISHIDIVIMQHNTLPSVPIPLSVIQQYSVTEKGFIDTKQYVLNIPLAYLSVADTDNPARCEMTGIFHKIKQIAQKIGEGANWANYHIYKKIQPFVNALAPPIISKGLQAASSGLDVIYANNAQDRIMNLANFRNDIGNFIDESRVRQSIENNRYIRLNPNVSRNINRAIGTHLAIPSNQTINGTQYRIQEVCEEDF
ncbi:MAG: hypothetical protein EZS28_013808 [Streblomastix strix]|uniref:Uncharacterized protein n=1 Tax=Streblomastix strix TaxID=222440 RepID=A0A5J4W7M5_9EUKA|nr:MAG: hypothetical protein EZS28_013808 [Streblomastix strix]